MTGLHKVGAFVRLSAAMVLAAVVLAWSWSPVLDAQGQGALRPPHLRPIFGEPDPRQTPEQASDGGLSLSGSLFGGYDDDLATDAGLTTPLRPHPEVSGTYSALGGRLLYDRLSDHLTFRANVASTVRYYPQFERFGAGRQFADLSSTWSAPLSRQSTFAVGGMARYSQHGMPFATSAFGSVEEVDDDGQAASEIDYGEDLVEARRRGTVGVEARLAHAIGRRQTVGLVAAAQTSELEGAERLDSYDTGGVFTSEVGRHGLFRAGYTLQLANRGISRYIVHHVDLGGDYQRPLSASRRGLISFSGGSAMLQSRGSTRIFLTGDAALRYALRAPWTVGVRYDRTFNFVDEVREPLFSDGITTDLDGILSRRLEFTGSASARRGTVGMSSSGSPYDMVGARARLRLGLTRNAAAYVEYQFFHYDFANSVDLAAGLPPALDRQTVRVGITFSTRLIR